ncbi:zinc finger protein-like protein RTS2 [Aaosphaeria arxii CBS 175.79]|uniref:Zinc finger protein-like protein RTS2 n=1 Tax=Aaosphaeria arxii CBS 175.79 TaxID=1450172 RepID=A0A6A5Y1W2_9PLEO|nr:zinc finger protein-like protein RTS2 [Aaosphaeria arxii CBS 175.79]KAF2018544.1 zinc finger protein-like protein RTS2 [Aaosphaeria arxii CBS 175.79]
MPRAEMGSQKQLANAMKSKGLQRLRWYCQPCQKQCRDANGYKCHTQSPSHVRQMQLIGEDPNKHIGGFSNDFQRDFISLLRTAHGEKYIGVNRFYQEYIRDKEHVHMNATKWSSLTEFAKHLGREGIVNVKEDEKDGLMIAWRDTSVEAVRRREDIRHKEAAEMKNSAGEDKMLERMAKRARQEAEAKAKTKAAQANFVERKDSGSPAAGANQSETPEDKPGSETTPKSQDENTAEEAQPTPAVTAPVKISFGMKTKVAPTQKAGLGQMKSQSIFKRARTENTEAKPVKKVKL